MPELPEVETVVRGLNRQVAGLTVKNVLHISNHLLLKDRDLRKLEGDSFIGFSRRGKFIVARMRSGKQLLLHLRMSGRILIEDNPGGPEKHDHLVITFAESRKRFTFRDIRKFGVVEWIGASQQQAIDQLGTEATDLTSANLRRLMERSSRPVKALLLDQHRIAGLGNIYADEALYRSRIHPLSACNALSDSEIARLTRAIRYILRTAIGKMGTTFDSYSGVNGNPGEYASCLKVYGRDGSICSRCKSEIVKIRAAGRGTHFCPGCQTS